MRFVRTKLFPEGIIPKSTVCLEDLAKRILSEKLVYQCFVIPIMHDVYFVYQQRTLFRKCQSSTSSAQNCDVNRVTAVHLNVFLQHFCFTGFGLLSTTSKMLIFLKSTAIYWRQCLKI